MNNIVVKRDDDNCKIVGEFVKCPVCGQKIFELKRSSGITEIRTVCRRCRSYLLIDIT